MHTFLLFLSLGIRQEWNWTDSSPACHATVASAGNRPYSLWRTSSEAENGAVEVLVDLCYVLLLELSSWTALLYVESGHYCRCRCSAQY